MLLSCCDLIMYVNMNKSQLISMSSHIADRTEKKQYNILCLRIDSFSWAAHLDTSLSRAFTVLFIRGPLNSSPSTVVAKKKKTTVDGRACDAVSSFVCVQRIICETNMQKCPRSEKNIPTYIQIHAYTYIHMYVHTYAGVHTDPKRENNSPAS